MATGALIVIFGNVGMRMQCKTMLACVPCMVFQQALSLLCSSASHATHVHVVQGSVFVLCAMHGVSTGALIVIFGNVDASAAVASINQGSPQACMYRATLSGVQNALQSTFRVQIDSRMSAMYSGA